jgi:ComF family protein
MAVQLLRSIMDLVFPPICPVCLVRLDPLSGYTLCIQCLSAISYLRPPLCRICGMEVAGEPERDCICGECLRAPPPFCIARSLVRYEPAVRQLIQKLKYAGDTSVLAGISALIGGGQLSEFTDCNLIIPVPLHAIRHRSRGLNQATILAGLFFPHKKNVLRPGWLIRARNTRSQTKLGGLERRRNLAGAFHLRSSNELNKAVVCLVDDVFTTGTTVAECSRTLLDGGAKEVRVLTLARTTKTL